MKKANTSDRLRQIMKEKNYRQVDILRKCEPYCEKYGIKLRRNDLSQYVNGKVEPKKDKLSILGMALNVNEAWLMGFDVPMESSANLSEQKDADGLENNYVVFKTLIDKYPDKVVLFISELCKNERIEKNYTEKFISKNCNLDLKEYLLFENHSKNIGTENIIKLLNFLCIDISYINGFLTGSIAFNTMDSESYMNILLKQFDTETRMLIFKLFDLIDLNNKENIDYLLKTLEENLSPNSQHETMLEKVKKAAIPLIQIKEE